MDYLGRVVYSVLMEIASVLLSFALFYIFLTATVTGVFDGDPVGAVFRDCENPCEVLYSPGGVLQRFQRAAKALVEGRNGRELVILNGSCYSGCAVFADLARERVCITKNVVFGFHKGYSFNYYFSLSPFGFEINTKRFDQPQSLDIDRWVRINGDYPEQGVTYMYLTDAKKFWRVCDLNPPLPRPDPRKISAAQ